MRLVSSLLTLACAFTSVLSGPLAARDVSTIEADLATISSQVTALDKTINAFPASGLTGALAIHEAAGTLDTAIKKGTTDTTAVSSVSEADGQTLITTVDGFEPTIINALTVLSGQKAAFDALPLGGVSALVLQDLKTLSTDTQAFETALTNIAPADLKSQATAISSAINAAFSKAIAAYS